MGMGMDIRPDSRGEELSERRLRFGRFHSPDQVVFRATETLDQSEQPPRQSDERRRAVEDRLAFAAEHRFTLGEALSIRDLLQQARDHRPAE